MFKQPPATQSQAQPRVHNQKWLEVAILIDLKLTLNTLSPLGLSLALSIPVSRPHLPPTAESSAPSASTSTSR